MAIEVGLGPLFRQEIDVGLKDIKCSRRATPRSCIDEDDAVVSFQNSARQIEAADAEINCHHTIGQRLLEQSVEHLDTKRVVSQKDVADSGNQNPLSSRNG